MSDARVHHACIVQHAGRRRRDPVRSALRIGPREEITQRPAAMRVQPATTAMLGCIVDHMTALAQGGQLVEVAVAGIVMNVRAG